MKNLIILLIASSILLSSCASTYKTIYPNTLNYSHSTTQKNIDLSYKHGVMKETGNKKYAKKEDKKNIRIIAVKLKNNSSENVEIGKDFKLKYNNGDLIQLSPEFVKQKIKQASPYYLFYMLLTFTRLNVNNSSYPIGLAIGPGITIGNIAVAATANNKLLKNLTEFNTLKSGTIIKPNETIFGLIGVSDISYGQISIE